jgi:hypothetical protein
LRAEIGELELPVQQLRETKAVAEPPPAEPDLPLLLDHPLPEIAPEWDPYPLESEFYTDQPLDAAKVAELVTELPGLEGCLIVKNRGPVLAARLPEKYFDLLRAPERNYHVLFERLEGRVHEYTHNDGRVATFGMGEEYLTLAQANHAFLVVNHRQPRLRPGISEKLAAVATEVAKMYP